MLISHEVPIAYLGTSIEFNDYDYCLVHLCDEHPDYLHFYKRSIEMGREVLLDNSIFELGTAYDAKKFAARIEEIKPTYYVVPDVLENAIGTMASWGNFECEYKDLPGLKIGVVQGKSVQEIIDCYRFMAFRADYLAISFDYSLYEKLGDGSTKLQRQATGRPRLVRILNELGVWDERKPHHLLGCSLASEFKEYRDIKGIRSVDTSNPIVAAIDGDRYLKDIGLRTKSRTKLADLIEISYDNDTRNLMVSNAAEFRKIAND